MLRCHLGDMSTGQWTEDAAADDDNDGGKEGDSGTPS